MEKYVIPVVISLVIFILIYIYYTNVESYIDFTQDAETLYNSLNTDYVTKDAFAKGIHTETLTVNKQKSDHADINNVNAIKAKLGNLNIDSANFDTILFNDSGLISNQNELELLIKGPSEITIKGTDDTPSLRLHNNDMSLNGTISVNSLNIGGYNFVRKDKDKWLRIASQKDVDKYPNNILIDNIKVKNNAEINKNLNATKGTHQTVNAMTVNVNDIIINSQGELCLSGTCIKKSQWDDVLSMQNNKQGPIGLKGSPGDRGEKGPKGDKGLIGDQGIQGPIGDIGPQGPQGDIGPDGNKGPTGLRGLKGKVGKTGELGSKGSIGLQGFPGNGIKTITIVNKQGKTMLNVILEDGKVLQAPINVSDRYVRDIEFKQTQDKAYFEITYSDNQVDHIDIPIPIIKNDTINIKGPQGSAGIKGNQGPPGIQGPKGLPGQDGVIIKGMKKEGKNLKVDYVDNTSVNLSLDHLFDNYSYVTGPYTDADGLYVQYNQGKPSKLASTVGCKLSDWSSWSKCDRTCKGTQKRSRFIVQAPHNKTEKCENEQEKRDCNMQCTCDLRIVGYFKPNTINLIGSQDVMLNNNKSLDELAETAFKMKKSYMAISLNSSGKGKTIVFDKYDGDLYDVPKTTQMKCTNGSDCGNADNEFAVYQLGSYDTFDEYIKNCQTASSKLISEDCVVSNWDDWVCNTDGRRIRRRYVTKPPKGVGKPCPLELVQETICPVDCVVDASKWTTWSACTNNQTKKSAPVLALPLNGGRSCQEVLNNPNIYLDNHEKRVYQTKSCVK